MSNGERSHTDPSDLAGEAEVLTELERLANRPGFVYALADISFRSTLFDPEAEQRPDGRLTPRELTTVAGLVAMQTVDVSLVPREGELHGQVERAYGLLADIHDILMRRMATGAKHAATLPRIASMEPPDSTAPPSGANIVEPFFYSGMGAQDFQYLELAVQKYAHDSSWFERELGFTIEFLVHTVKELQDLRERRMMDYLQSLTHEDKCRTVLATFSFTREDLSWQTDEQFTEFIARFAVNPGDVNHQIRSVGAENILEYRPIMQIGQNHFFLPVGFMLAKAVYEQPTVWMGRDGTYKNEAAKNRGDATEEIAQRLLAPIFGDKLYPNVQLFGLKGKVPVAEIDLLAVAGNRALIIEAKSKGLTLLARQGDDDAIRTDIHQGIQEAYNQASRSRSLLRDRSYRIATSNHQEVVLPDSLSEIYVMCVKLDDFPVLPYITSEFVERDPDAPQPVVITLFDLDVLTTYLNNPFRFIHYLDERNRSYRRAFAPWEISLLALYLTTGLPLLEDSPLFSLPETFARPLERNFRYVRDRNKLIDELFGVSSSESPYTTFESRWMDTDRDALVGWLRNSSNPQATEALFNLFDMEAEALGTFLANANKIRQETGIFREPGLVASVLTDRTGVAFQCVDNQLPRAHEFLERTTIMLKHENRSSDWMTLGQILGSDEILIIWPTYQWRPDRGLDDEIRTLQEEQPLQELDVHDPCWCSSGLEYGKCHLADQ